MNYVSGRKEKNRYLAPLNVCINKQADPFQADQALCFIKKDFHAAWKM